MKNLYKIDDELYIVSASEKIKENTQTRKQGFNGDWFYNTIYNFIARTGDITAYDFKIILTTNKLLIADGIQSIPDEFLEWFVKNPSCESVKVVYEPKNFLDIRQGYEYVIIIPKEELAKTQIDWSGFPKSTQEQVGFTELNIIDDWLDKNGNPEIAKQVEQEAEELCKQEKNNFIESFLVKNSFKKKQNNVFYNLKCTIKVLENCYQIDFKNNQYGEVRTYTECLSIPYLVGTLTWHELISRNYKK